jgi:hypothetical protein
MVRDDGMKSFSLFTTRLDYIPGTVSILSTKEKTECPTVGWYQVRTTWYMIPYDRTLPLF